MNPRIRDILDRTEGRPDADSLDNGGFHWRTNEGVYLRPDQMETLHLFHTVRLLWNHTVPAKHHLTPFRQWTLTLDADERAEAMTEMLAELGRRLDKSVLTPAQRAELEVIRLKDKVWKAALADWQLDPGDEGDYDENLEALYRDLAMGD